MINFSKANPKLPLLDLNLWTEAQARGDTKIM